MITRSKNIPANFFLDSFFNVPTKRRTIEPIVNKRIAYNIIKKETGFTMEFAVPGFSKEDFSVKMEDKKLVVKMEKELEKKGDYKRKEYEFGSFEKKFNLPSNIDQDKISASYENGVLAIELVYVEKVTKEINIL